ncbi:hypothetical protein OnM2_047057 [Erysiphe neolycopersici]|uniref:Uncharacterized protein n=1 Tax=Erysiphe neolycopersici TaxID=212602 RepID=A0A420HTP9_9PEZI|nr:hypothetical protein OnM2_047057 [Erysiphe neolycopersici]
MNTTLEKNTNCTTLPTNIKPNSNIGGIGVLTSFIITAAASILLSCIIVLREFRHKKKSIVARRMLLSLSDQQIITGIALMILGLIHIRDLSYHHFFILWMFSLLSTVTHVSTILALGNEIKRDWVRRWLRQAVISINFLLSFSYCAIIFKASGEDLFNEDETWISIVYLLNSSHDIPWTDTEASRVIIVGLQIMMLIISVFYLRVHIRGKKRIFLVKSICLLFFTLEGAIVTRSMMLEATDRNSLLNKEEEEDFGNFGQVLPVLLLILPIISAIEQYREKVKAPENYIETEATGIERATTFEPNPIWGKRMFLT